MKNTQPDLTASPLGVSINSGFWQEFLNKISLLLYIQS